MANVFRNLCTYYQLPQALVTSTALANLSGNACKLYAFLCFHAQKNSSPSFSLLNSDITPGTGLSADSIKARREELVNANLILAERRTGNIYRYTLINPESGEPIRKYKHSNLASGAGHGLYGRTPEDHERYYVNRLKGRIASQNSNGLSALCPFHEDSRASLSINLEKGVWKCHACGEKGGMQHMEQKLFGVPGDVAYRHVVEFLDGKQVSVSSNAGLHHEAIYDYFDAEGELRYQILRLTGKRFMARRPEGEGWVNDLNGVKKILYQLPLLSTTNYVVMAEGEKDADAINRLDLVGPDSMRIVATTNPFGAGHWDESYTTSLAGKSVVVIPDNDAPGIDHAMRIEKSLIDVAEQVTVVMLPEGKDVSEFLENHHGAELLRLLGWEPEV